jgi:hypothetical protein
MPSPSGRASSYLCDSTPHPPHPWQSSTYPKTLRSPSEPEPGDIRGALATRRQSRQPIIPLWLRTRADALRVLGWSAEHAGYIAGYHASRAHLYGRCLVGEERRPGQAVTSMRRPRNDGPPARCAAAGRSDVQMKPPADH